MKRLAILIGGLLVMPAFAEVAPVFIDEDGALEYADGMYDGNGFLVVPGAEIVDAETETATTETQTPVKISRAPVNATPVANRTTTTRAMPASAGATTASGRGSANGNSSRVVAARTTTTSPRGTASRTVASRGTTATSPRTGTTSTRTATSTAATRAAAARTTGGATRATSATTGATVARTATSTGRTTAARTATATTARAATGADRVSIRGTSDFSPGTKTNQVSSLGAVNTTIDPLYKSASTRRTPTIRMSSLNGISAETTAVSTMSLEDMDDLAELTDYCKAQYANCMDNYCNVLDDNQGRCSCSANIKNYAKAEQALKTATEELQDVAQKIQYIGLTSREVETLFTETIAEETMRTSGTDTSQLQASLNKIKDMIIDVKSGTATSSASNDILGLNFDLSGLLEFSFDSTGFDLGSLFGTTTAGSVSNQRGEELYKTAAARCKSSVLKACTARGVDASLITNAYDLEIDRECMAYERSLNDSNDQMLATVRNAKNVLQKARLMVAQQKNAYDMRGCINALDACMQDEFVCGSDYENCLDPTGRYIVNGEIVVGSQPGHAIDPEISSRVSSVMTSDVCRVNLYRTWDMPGEKTCDPHEVGDAGHQGSGYAANYISYPTTDQNNAWGSGTGDTLAAYIKETVSATSAQNVSRNASENMSYYLQNKIGYNDKDRNYGMCMSVLNKCQDYTYDGKGTNTKYKQDNEVIKQYLARVLVQIKAKQDEILANYAETCVSDVTSCLGQNGYPTEDPSEWDYSSTYGYSTYTTKMNIAVNACRAQIVTCMSVNGYSIDTPTPTEMNCWVQGLLYSTSTGECMQNNVHPGACDTGYEWCTTVEPATCVQSGTCPTAPTEYAVTIKCDGGTLNITSPKNTSNGVLQLNGSWCTRTGYNITGWKCNNALYGVNGSYEPQTATNECVAQWPGGEQNNYTVDLKCDDKCTGNEYYHTVAQGYEIDLSQWCAGSNQTAEWNGFCAQATNGSIIVNQNITCNASCTTGRGTSDPEWVTVNFNYGTATDVTLANPSKLYVDATHQACYEAYDTTATVDGEKCPANIVYNITVPSATGLIFDGFYNGNTEYINENGVIQNAFYNIDDNITLTAHWKSPAAGGMRYVQIEDNDGARTPRTRGNAYQLNAVWIDTDGSTCQYPGVYIADPKTNMVVCASPVDTIGWWVKPGSRSSGFYIDVNGEKVLFAREWGEIVTENIGKFAATDPDTTLVATPTVYDTNVGYVSFDEENKTWTDTYSTSRVDQYAYLHNKFNIDFYPNRPGKSASQEEYRYTYIEGDNYYKRNGSPTNNAPTITETGYTFRGFYPGQLPAVSSDSSTGMVWPATTGGMSPVTLPNKKWVLVTDNPDFQTLNLYAAWAKNCPNPLPEGMKKCNLTIGTDGSVTYAVECQDGYEIQGAGADAKCITPGSNWRSVTFDGATVVY